MRLDDRYVLDERIGAGEMSQVWRATDEVIGTPVAVKVLTAGLAGDPGGHEAVWDEVRAVTRLTHPNIARVYDSGRAPLLSGVPAPYLVMELVAGESVADRLAAGPLPWPDAARVGAQVAAALAAAHERGVVHGRIEPGNVVLTAAGPAREAGRIKVRDFGVAALAGAIDRGGSVSAAAGAFPEQRKSTPALPANDVYALGVLLYDALTGDAGPAPDGRDAPPVADGRDVAGGAHAAGGRDTAGGGHATDGRDVADGREVADRRDATDGSDVADGRDAADAADGARIVALPDLPPEAGELLRACLSPDPAQRPAARLVATTLAALAGMPDPTASISADPPTLEMPLPEITITPGPPSLRVRVSRHRRASARRLSRGRRVAVAGVAAVVLGIAALAVAATQGRPGETGVPGPAAVPAPPAGTSAPPPAPPEPSATPPPTPTRSPTAAPPDALAALAAVDQTIRDARGDGLVARGAAQRLRDRVRDLAREIRRPDQNRQAERIGARLEELTQEIDHLERDGELTRPLAAELRGLLTRASYEA